MMQVAIVHHLDMPIMRQRAFHIAPGTENQIPITPTLYTANPQVMSVFTSKFTKLGHSNDFTYSIFVFVECKVPPLHRLLFAMYQISI